MGGEWKPEWRARGKPEEERPSPIRCVVWLGMPGLSRQDGIGGGS